MTAWGPCLCYSPSWSGFQYYVQVVRYFKRMRAYSFDSRERVAAACLAQAGRTIGEVAAQFNVSGSFVRKLRRRQRTNASLATLPRRSDPAPCLNATALAQLVACLRQEPGATPVKPGTWLAAIGSTVVSQSTLRRAVQALDWWEKKSMHATERDTQRVRALRRAFVEALPDEDVTCFKFMDGTSTNLTCCRRYAWTVCGQRAHQATPLHSGPNVTLVAALAPTGLRAAMTVSGAVNGDVFAAYLSQVLGPTLGPGDVAVPANLPAHKVAGLAKLVEASGPRLLYLPPYSPGSNPVVLVFSKLKTWLRPAQARTRQALEDVISAATDWMTTQDAKNWSDHCGYHAH